MTIPIERETVINFNDAEDQVKIWSASPVFQRKMKKLGVEPTIISHRTATEASMCYSVPKTWIRVKPPTTRKVSPEQKAALAARGRFLFKSTVSNHETQG